MTLCVLGRQSVEELKSIVVDMFSGIVNKDVEIPPYSEGPYLEEHLKVRIDIVPVQDTRSLSLRFPVPYHFETRYEAKVCFNNCLLAKSILNQLYIFILLQPASYLYHLIGHEGKGSLLSSLKKLGFANCLYAYSHFNDGFGFFEIVCDLTENGIGEFCVLNGFIKVRQDITEIFDKIVYKFTRISFEKKKVKTY